MLKKCSFCFLLNREEVVVWDIFQSFCCCGEWSFVAELSVGFVYKPFPVFLCCSWSCLPRQEMSWWSFWLTRRNPTLSPVLSYQWSEYGHSILPQQTPLCTQWELPAIVCTFVTSLTCCSACPYSSSCFTWFISWYVPVLLFRWQNLWRCVIHVVN